MTKHKQESNVQEQLAKTVDVGDTIGEGAAVTEYFSPQFDSLPPDKRFDIQMAVQKVLLGDKSLAANYDLLADEIAKLKQRQIQMDAEAKQFEQDRERWMERMERLYEKNVKTGAEKEKVQAQGAKMSAQAHQVARASQTQREYQLQQRIDNDPKVSITSPGIPKQVRNPETHVLEMKLFPEEIRIGRHVWTLPPNQATEVPEIAYKQYQFQRQLLEEKEAREGAFKLDGTNIKEVGEINKRIQDVNKKYGASQLLQQR